MDRKARENQNMPLTLEMHLSDLSLRDTASKELEGMYNLLKKRLENRLVNSRAVFVEYSLHDASHSRSIIHSIERFLGETRIQKLSATDTFMLLACAYAHDYGMIKTFNKIYELLGSEQFKEYLEKNEESSSILDKDDIEAIRNLLHHIREERPNVALDSLYLSIMHVIQLYLRPTHPEGVVNIKNEFEGLFSEHLKRRFVYGSEGITEICMCHGKDFDSLFEMAQHADGIIGDDFHPRFIAAMIRLGDLLDLDNDRFPEWFLKEALKEDTVISDLSILHARKHESITHLLITDQIIDIEAHCDSIESGFETAMLVSQWTDAIKEECEKLVLHWSNITQPDFGLPPGNVDVRIYVDNQEFSSVNQVLQMQMSQERVMDLLEGTSIYQNQYVGIRELLQNAVDASLIQMWIDIQQNRYKSLGISKDSIKKGTMKLAEFAKIEKSNEIFGNYDITIELIKNLDKKRVEVVIKDRGVGISKEDLKYIADIGSSRENNTSRKKILNTMPAWLSPSGIFGIGLQSVFQLTECIEFYTRQHNLPERKIALFSYGKNRGRLVESVVPPNKDGLYYNNSIPGTNAKIIINPEKILSKPLNHYDLEFDKGDQLDIIYAEICQACKDIIKEQRSDYFDIKIQELTIIKEDTFKEEDTIHDDVQKGRECYFTEKNKNKYFGYSAYPLFKNRGKALNISKHIAYYWDDENHRAYRLEVRPCVIKERDKAKQVYLPQKVPNLYRVSYKFNKISQSETIYLYNDIKRHSHAGFLIWDIQILDNQQTRYLNIDRDRLRNGAIKEEELLAVRNTILDQWCRELISNVKVGKFLSNNMGMLLSFVFLFYQNVREDLFENFINLYGSFLQQNFCIGDERIPIENIWLKGILFYSDEKYFEEEMDVEKTIFEETGNYGISLETVKHFPHRLVHPERIISTGNGSLRYVFKFNTAKYNNHMIAMDDYSRAVDYTLSMMAEDVGKKKFACMGLQKRAFKPDEKYKHLIVSKYPSTFKRGENFSNYLDECIRDYILSPFEEVTAKGFQYIINKAGDYKDNEDDESIKKWSEMVVKSRRFTQCIEYVTSNCVFREANMSESEFRDLIQKEYKEFANQFCLIMIKYKQQMLHLQRTYLKGIKGEYF